MHSPPPPGRKTERRHRDVMPINANKKVLTPPKTGFHCPQGEHATANVAVNKDAIGSIK
jgi:hypothetical protein